MNLNLTVTRADPGAIVKCLSVFAVYSDQSTDCGALDPRTSIDRVIDLASNAWAGPNRNLITLTIRELS